MPRTPHEATRFTATHPHAQSRSAATTIPLPTSPPPANETPHQKVARLREAARRAKMNQESTWDRVVLRGRVWADRAHRVTATGLILASVVATGFAALSFGDMMMANRQKKKAFYAQQEAAYAQALLRAREAESNGTLTSDLALFLNKERAIEQAETEAKATPSFWQRTKGRMFGGLKMDEAGDSSELAAVAAGAGAAMQGQPVHRPEEDPSEVLHAPGREQASRMGTTSIPSLVEASPVPKTSAEDSRVVESRAVRRRGPLDSMGDNTASLFSGLFGR